MFALLKSRSRNALGLAPVHADTRSREIGGKARQRLERREGQLVPPDMGRKDVTSKLPINSSNMVFSTKQGSYHHQEADCLSSLASTTLSHPARHGTSASPSSLHRARLGSEMLPTALSMAQAHLCLSDLALSPLCSLHSSGEALVPISISV